MTPGRVPVFMPRVIGPSLVKLTSFCICGEAASGIFARSEWDGWLRGSPPPMPAENTAFLETGMHLTCMEAEIRERAATRRWRAHQMPGMALGDPGALLKVTGI